MISELAESVAEENIKKGAVSLENIAEKNDITYSYGNYGNSFLGLLEHKAGEFHVYLNLDKHESEEHPRTRFTFSHEYGHFFIKEHKNCLLNGISLSYAPEFSYFTSNVIENEANLFASNLLLPKTRFLNKINKSPLGFEAILIAASHFKASITSTTIRFVNLDIVPSMVFYWDEGLTLKWKWMSGTFMKLISFSRDMVFTLRLGHILNILHSLDPNRTVEVSEIYEETGLLSNWIPSIPLNSSRNVPVTEQTIKLGKYGGLTLIIPHV